MSENNEKVLAEDFLAQAYRIDQQIQCKVDQLSRIRAICGCPATGFANARVQSSGQTSRVEDMVVKIMDEERAINEEIDRLVDTRCQIRQVIDRMPNVTQRLVLEKRSLLFQTWQQIGADLHLSARWAQVIYRNAVRAVQEILDQNEGEE